MSSMERPFSLDGLLKEQLLRDQSFINASRRSGGGGREISARFEKEMAEIYLDKRCSILWAEAW